jgi:hypothetical protein
VRGHELIRSLSEHRLEHLCNQIIKHLRLSAWQQATVIAVRFGSSIGKVGIQVLININACVQRKNLNCMS